MGVSRKGLFPGNASIHALVKGLEANDRRHCGECRDDTARLGRCGRLCTCKHVGGMVAVLHKTIGITLPSPEKERAVALIWIVSMVVIGDGMLFLLLFLTGAVVKG